MNTVSSGVSKLLRNVAVCAAMALGLVFCASPALATEKMSAADRSNLAKALGFIKAADEGDRTLAESYLATNVRWWVAGIGVMDKDEILDQWTAPVGAPKRSPLPSSVISNTFSAANRVAFEVATSSNKPDGNGYNNTYVYIWFFRDGKIVEVHEYMDTAYAFAHFGLTPNIGKTALRPTDDRRFTLKGDQHK